MDRATVIEFSMVDIEAGLRRAPEAPFDGDGEGGARVRPQAAAPGASRRTGEAEAEGVDGVAVQRTREVEDDSEETEVMKVTTYNGGAWAANERHLAMLGGGWADRGVVLVQEHKLVGEDATKEKAEKLRGAAWNSIWGARPPR